MSEDSTLVEKEVVETPTNKSNDFFSRKLGQIQKEWQSRAGKRELGLWTVMGSSAGLLFFQGLDDLVNTVAVAQQGDIGGALLRGLSGAAKLAGSFGAGETARRLARTAVTKDFEKNRGKYNIK